MPLLTNPRFPVACCQKHQQHFAQQPFFRRPAPKQLMASLHTHTPARQQIVGSSEQLRIPLFSLQSCIFSPLWFTTQNKRQRLSMMSYAQAKRTCGDDSSKLERKSSAKFGTSILQSALLHSIAARKQPTQPYPSTLREQHLLLQGGPRMAPQLFKRWSSWWSR